MSEQKEKAPSLQIAQDVLPLYESFEGEVLASAADLIVLAQNRLDFRAGHPREETLWEEGAQLSDAQKKRHST